MAIEEVITHYPSKSDLDFSIVFVDKHAKVQTFIELNSDENFMEMLTMYENEKEVCIYVTTDKNIFGTSSTKEREQDETINEHHEEDNSDSCPTEDGSHSCVDSCFTITKFKEAYALEIAPLPGKNQWVERERSEKIYQPILKRPPGRPKKDRIKPPGEAKKRHKCPRCGGYGHHEKKCKNPSSQVSDPNQASKSKRRRKKITKARKAVQYEVVSLQN